ncbi:MAG: PrsW family glutamic-type intramembrane protease [Patescibacteria group bacterium]
MQDNPLLLLGISTFFAAVPAVIWLFVIFSKAEKGKKTVLLIFLLGCLTAPALLGLQYLWDEFPQFNLAAFIENNVQSQNAMFMWTFVLFGAMEEIIKFYVVKAVDQKTLLVNRINDAVRFSLAAALGFSFTENIYYLYQFWPSVSQGELIGMYIFRSIFTTCAHMIFSGIFGYYYGIGKFTITLTEQQKITGKSSFITRLISELFGISLTESFKQKMILKGLFLALFIHATYNYLLQFNAVLPVIIFVVLGFLYLQYLFSRKTGHLILTIDPSSKKGSVMAKKDEDVVVELMGMWFNEKRYVDVLHICERLLERDPDNEVVQLFKAKALDKMDDKDTYKKILNTVVKTKDDLSENQKNIISKYLTEKESKQKIANTLPKQETKPLQTEQKEASPQSKDVLDKFTGEGTFSLKPKK